MKVLSVLITLGVFSINCFAESMGTRQCQSTRSGLVYVFSDDIVNEVNCFQVYEDGILLISKDLKSVEYRSAGRVYKYGDQYSKVEIYDQTECGWFSCDYRFVVNSQDYPELNDVLTDCRVVD